MADVTFRAFDDVDGEREALYGYARSAFDDFEPLENATHRLEIADVDYKGPYNPKKRDEKKALLQRGSVHRPLYGTLRLVDKATNQTIEERRTILAHIPHVNSRGLMIRNGVAWSPHAQLRLRPGVYSRIQNDGNAEAMFNVRPGTGRGFRIYMDAKDGVMRLKVGQSTTRLLPLLRELGVTDDQLKEAWGEDLYNTNYRKPAATDLQEALKVAKKLNSRLGDVPPDLARDVLRESFARASFDGDVTERTLGQRYENASPEAILATTRKLIRVARKEDTEDNRDSQAYQSIHTIEDVIKDRLRRDQAGALRNLLYKASKKGTLGNVPSGLLNKNISSVFTGSGLVIAPTNINPIDGFDIRQSITRMGEGGISSERSASLEARGVQASYLGVIDATRGPECYDSRTEVLSREGWLAWTEVTESTELACLVDGTLVFAAPSKLHTSHYAGTMYGSRSELVNYLVTPNHRMLVRDAYGEFSFITPDKVLPAEHGFLSHDSDRVFSVGESDCYTIEYSGMVYCATVPGGMLCVRREGCPGFWCGNSGKLGLDLRATDGALKGSDNQLYTKVIDARTGEEKIVSARDLSASVVAFPGEFEAGKKRLTVVRDDTLSFAKPEEVDYVIPSASSLMSRATAMVPLPEAIKGQRLLMGSRMTAQALPLAKPEAPLVQTADDLGDSIYEKMGAVLGAARAPAEGVVVHVDEDSIQVRGKDGQIHEVDLYNNYPISPKTSLTNTSVVKPGDVVKPNQLLARSNFTDDKGVAATGTNLRIAFMVAEGDTIEDAFVISESAAKKLAPELTYKTSVDLKDNIKSTAKDDYLAVFSTKFNEEQLSKVGDDGIAAIGTTLNPGDPVVLGIGTKSGRGVGAVMESQRSSVADRTQTWDHHAPGVVTDVVKTKNGIQVLVKSVGEIGPGWKLAPRYGSKGVVSRIVPDAEMPVDAEGRPIEVISNALGSISRVNPGYLAEALLGKVAEKRGEPYKIKGFSGNNVLEFALSEAEKYGVVSRDKDGNIVDTETLTDPRDGRKINNIFTGKSYIMHLHHTAESKMSARGEEGGYTYEGLPAKSGKQSSKRLGLLDDNVLVAANATEFLRDAKLIRGQRNDDYWRALKFGGTPVEPDESFANEHFRTLLTAGGVKLTDRGKRTQLSALTDTDVDSIAQEEIENGETFDMETMTPIPGGLFDIGKTGGADGNRFAKITLPVKLPHPLFRAPISSILGISEKQLESVLIGEKDYNGKKGPEAIEEALKAINVDREIENAKVDIRATRGQQRDAAVKRLHYLAGLKKTETSPDALLISKVPVIPPKFRPVIAGTKTDTIHDLNYLYHDLLEARENYTMAKQAFGSAGEEYRTLMKAVGAVAGVEDPVNPETAEQEVKGVLQFAIGIGATPKRANFQRKVIGASVNTVGRGVITSDKDLDIDEIGVPRAMAQEMFKPFVIRRLVQGGYDPAEAVKQTRDWTPAANKALEEEIKVRPVVTNRAPALHRFAYVGGWAKLREDDAIGLPYPILKGLGADYDGDQALGVLTIQHPPTVYVQGARMSSAALASIPTITKGNVVTLADMQDFPHTSAIGVSDGKNGKIAWFNVPDGVKVLSYDDKTGKPVWATVTCWSEHYDRIVEIAELSSGYQIISDNDPRAVYGLDVNTLEERRDSPRNAVGAIMVPRVTNVPSVADELTEVTVPDSIRSKAYTAKTAENLSRVAWSLPSSLSLTEECGYLFGALIGDGWSSGRKGSDGETRYGQVNLAGNDADVFAAVKNAMQAVLPGIEATPHQFLSGDSGDRHGDSRRDTYSSAEFARLLVEWCGAGAKNKHLPPFYLAANESFRRGLFGGLMDTDGTLAVSNAKKKPQVMGAFTSISLRLVREVRILAASLGIRGRISAYRYKEQDATERTKEAWQLTFSTVDIVKWGGKGMNCARKTAKITGVECNENSPAAARVDLVPLPPPLAVELSKGLLSKAPNEYAHCRKQTGFASRVVARQIIAAHGREHVEKFALGPKWLRLVDNESVTWDRVESYEDTGIRETGYDLTVPGYETFMNSDGVILSNTQNIHVPVSDAAVNEVKEKLMPSKSLISPATFEAHMTPVQDYTAGLYLATTPDESQPVQTFNTKEDAKRAYRQGLISARTPIRILEE